MTKQELIKELEKEPLTLKRAFELSIKKWENIMEHWLDMSNDIESPYRPHTANCALCVMFMDREYYEQDYDIDILPFSQGRTDTLCPLSIEGKSPCTGRCTDEYFKFMDAIEYKDRKEATESAESMVRLLKMELAYIIEQEG